MVAPDHSSPKQDRSASPPDQNNIQRFASSTYGLQKWTRNEWDSFRQLLQGSRKSGSSTTLGVGSGSRAKLAVPQKQKVAEAAKPTFKPRKVTKPQDSRYRDRAAERRDGQGNDYAHVEAVLEDFEKKHAEEEDKEKAEAQRQYLGGDSDHSVLVKGLDFALLEQQKAKSGRLSKDDLDALDQAFQEASTHAEPELAPPKKRTREELIQELKKKRTGGKAPALPTDNEAKGLEDAKQQGKFKPIGFKPIGSSGKKRKETGGEEKKKKKKRKVGDDPAGDSSKGTPSQVETPTSQPPASESSTTPAVSRQVAEPVDDDFDIFAGAGDYTGLDIDDEDDDEGVATRPKPTEDHDHDLEEGEEPSTSAPPRRWFDNDDDAGPSLPTKPALNLVRQPEPPAIGSSSRATDDEDMDEDRPIRLAGLEGSTVPSIKDLLAMDEAAAKYEKKQKMKEKKKKKVKGDDDDD